MTEIFQVDGTDLADVPLQIREMDPGQDRPGLLRLLGEIYPTVPPQTLAERLEEIEGSGWRCVGVWQDGHLVALSGFWIQTRFYCGRFLYIDHFVVTASRRSCGIGPLLLGFLHDLAVREGCDLTCGDIFVTNERAQRYWQREGYRQVGVHFTRPTPAIDSAHGGQK